MNDVNANEDSDSLSAVESLIEWAKEQDQWIRLLASRVIRSKSPLTGKDFADAYEFFSCEKGLLKGEIDSSEIEWLHDDFEATGEQFFLTALSHLQGVNKLEENQTLEFNNRLTVIFGENGVGKTGYSRILKRVAGLRSAEDVLPNVEIGGASEGPRARIAFQIGDKNDEFAWTSEVGIEPLNRIAVFDSRSAQLHVDGDLNFQYTPGELALFKFVHQGVEAVKAALDKEVTDKSSRTPVFLNRFTRGTEVYKEIETLGAATDTDKLKAFAENATQQRVDELTRQVHALQSGNAEAEAKVLTDDYAKWLSVQNYLEKLSALRKETLIEAIQKVDQLREKDKELSVERFAKEGVTGIDTEQWKEFIYAAQEYIESQFSESYPQKEDRCALCLQDLDERSLLLIKGYLEIARGDLRKQLADSVLALKKTASDFIFNDIASILKWSSEKVTALKEKGGEDSFLTNVDDFNRLVASLSAELPEIIVEKFEEIKALAHQIKNPVQERVESTKKSLDLVTSKEEDRSKNLRELRTSLHEARDRLELKSVLEQVLAYCDNCKWIDKAERVAKQFRKLGRSITELSKQVSEEIISKDFEKHFDSESQALRCPAVTLDFPGRRAEPARRKSIVANYQVSDILSDGEQKVIALADFLAEASISNNTAPIIFDDPITSLDYKRMEHVVQRLIEVSKERQVIIFTHNIWFVVELMQKFQNSPSECSYFEVSEVGGAKGIIEKREGPRTYKWDSVKKEMNGIIAQAENAQGTAQEFLIRGGYSHLRSCCEIAVEERLLKGTVRRLAPNIMFGKFSEIKPEGLQLAQEKISPIFERCCRKMIGHSQPVEVTNVKPDIDALKEDWNELLAVAKQL